MQINIITVSKKVPDWVTIGFNDYNKRFPREYPLHLIDIPAEKRSNLSTEKVLTREAERILQVIPKDSYTIALDMSGKSIDTQQLAEKIAELDGSFSKINFIIGGADGLHSSCIQKSNECISLSKFTFPHALVRIILIEQLYRAISILKSHPYHRE